MRKRWTSKNMNMDTNKTVNTKIHYKEMNDHEMMNMNQDTTRPVIMIWMIWTWICPVKGITWWFSRTMNMMKGDLPFIKSFNGTTRFGTGTVTLMNRQMPIYMFHSLNGYMLHGNLFTTTDRGRIFQLPRVREFGDKLDWSQLAYVYGTRSCERISFILVPCFL